MIKKFNRIILISWLFAALGTSVSAQTEKRIEEIRKIYDETNQKIAESNAEGEFSSVFLTQLIVNKNNGSYPAVGIYQPAVKFYYTYGDREKNPYPNRLLKIEIEIKRAGRTETAEFLFNETGHLIFYFGKKDDEEKRVYFSGEKPIRVLTGTKNVPLNEKTAADLVKTILAEKRKLTGIFSGSLDF